MAEITGSEAGFVGGGPEFVRGDVVRYSAAVGRRKYPTTHTVVATCDKGVYVRSGGGRGLMLLPYDSIRAVD